MLPPRYPKSPRQVINYDQRNSRNSDIPYPNQRTNSQQKFKYGSSSSLDSKSKVSKYEHLKTTQQKRKALGKRRYINQLAYLDYEDKHTEVHTKYTMASKISAMKKIKAKNQMAQFNSEQQEQEVGFEELMDYKYGKQSNNDNFHFEKNELVAEYKFCNKCDLIHNDHPEVHQKICKEKIQFNEEYDKRNPDYVLLSLKRIENSLKRTSGQQYDSLKQLVKNLTLIQAKNTYQTDKKNGTQKLNKKSKDFETSLKFLYQLLKVNENDLIIKKLVEKILVELYKKQIK